MFNPYCVNKYKSMNEKIENLSIIKVASYIMDI